jgi:hypothetical protein
MRDSPLPFPSRKTSGYGLLLRLTSQTCSAHAVPGLNGFEKKGEKINDHTAIKVS